MTCSASMAPSKPDGHLYWSRAPSNAPPQPKTLKEAQAALASDAVVSDKEWTPLYKWGQRRSEVVLTIFVPCLQKEATTVDVRPKAVSFRAERVAAFAGNKKEQRLYTLSLQLFSEVDADRAQIFMRHDHVRIELPKIHGTPWRTLQEAGIPKSALPCHARIPLANGFDTCPWAVP